MTIFYIILEKKTFRKRAIFLLHFFEFALTEIIEQGNSKRCVYFNNKMRSTQR